MGGRLFNAPLPLSPKGKKRNFLSYMTHFEDMREKTRVKWRRPFYLSGDTAQSLKPAEPGES